MAYSLDTTVGEIITDTSAVEILEKQAPDATKHTMVGMAKAYALKQILDMAQAKECRLTEDMVNK